MIAGILVSLLTFLDLQLQQALRVGSSGGEFDLELFYGLIISPIINSVLISLSHHLFIYLLPDPDDIMH